MTKCDQSGYGYFSTPHSREEGWINIRNMSARLGASRAFAKSRNQELLKRRASGVPSGNVRNRSSNSEGKGRLETPNSIIFKAIIFHYYFDLHKILRKH